MLGKGGASLWIVNAAMALAAFFHPAHRKKTDCLVSHAPVSFKGMGKFDVLLPALCLFFRRDHPLLCGHDDGLCLEEGEGYWGVAALAAVVLEQNRRRLCDGPASAGGPRRCSR